MKLCVVLDLENKERCLELVRELKDLDIWLKTGPRSYIRDGLELIEELKKLSTQSLFLDLKIYDIPNTMSDACEERAKFGVNIMNFHASAGKKAMQNVIQRLAKMRKRPLAPGVSALTSLDEEEFYSIHRQNLKEVVINLSKLAYESRLDGTVCSVSESLLIKQDASKNFLTLIPVIRPFKEEVNDQRRVANLESTKANKSDFTVVGRPTYEALNPKGVYEKILANL